MSEGIVVSFATEKGGSKKTTQNQILAEIFADLGQTVNILDFDPQGTMLRWVERRDQLIEEGYEISKINIATEYDKDNFYDAISNSIKEYDITIIDPPGTDGEALREVYISASLIIIPVTPVQNDLETLPSIKRLLTKTQKRFNSEAIVRTMFVDLPTHANDRSKSIAMEYLKEINFLEDAPLLNAYTKHRKVYSDAQVNGLTAFSVDNEISNFECNLLKKDIIKLLEE
tara:strand:+ start:29389 stop:30075 length:687 start_codon:yes stop_codon:yes gene_type:complete